MINIFRNDCNVVRMLEHSQPQYTYVTASEKILAFPCTSHFVILLNQFVKGRMNAGDIISPWITAFPTSNDPEKTYYLPFVLFWPINTVLIGWWWCIWWCVGSLCDVSCVDLWCVLLATVVCVFDYIVYVVRTKETTYILSYDSCLHRFFQSRRPAYTYMLFSSKLTCSRWVWLRFLMIAIPPLPWTSPVFHHTNRSF